MLYRSKKINVEDLHNKAKKQTDLSLEIQRLVIFCCCCNKNFAVIVNFRLLSTLWVSKKCLSVYIYTIGYLVSVKTDTSDNNNNNNMVEVLLYRFKQLSPEVHVLQLMI